MVAFESKRRYGFPIRAHTRNSVYRKVDKQTVSAYSQWATNANIVVFTKTYRRYYYSRQPRNNLYFDRENYSARLTWYPGVSLSLQPPTHPQSTPRTPKPTNYYASEQWRNDSADLQQKMSLTSSSLDWRRIEVDGELGSSSGESAMLYRLLSPPLGGARDDSTRVKSFGLSSSGHVLTAYNDVCEWRRQTLFPADEAHARGGRWMMQ